jgi:Tol biopolymer transport system component/putative hemolysin
MKKIYILLILLALSLFACTARKTEVQPEPKQTEARPAEIANPASQYCEEQGGTLTIEERGDGGQFGVCYFEDNYQCEEWAMLRGDCPVGGLKVTGYITPDARYCAITGGTYAIIKEGDPDTEQGTCTFKNSAVCDAWEYYNGACDASTAMPPTAAPEADARSGDLVFDSTRSGPYRDIYTMYADGSDVLRLTHGEANSIAGPWSPDGLQILYTGFGLINSFIASMNADGNEQITLSSIQGSDEGFPDWSPDGKRIAFTSRRDGNNEIYLMNADGSDPIRLTNVPGDDFAPSWSPDGRQIVFVSDRDQSAGIYDLYIMNSDGSGMTRLTNDTASDYSPDWSPDGKQIVFRSHHDGPADIYVINVDGSGLTQLTDDPADDWAPSWSPDGSLIAFQTNRDGDWEVYQMDADGSNPENLTNDPANDQAPFWRP